MRVIGDRREKKSAYNMYAFVWCRLAYAGGSAMRDGAREYGSVI